MHSGFKTNPAQILEALYQKVYENEFKGLPICNDDIQVQAIGFQIWEGQWLGILVTPWFTNLLILRQQGQHWPELKLGKQHQQEITFPAGTIKFTPRFEPELGTYLCCSLVSPMTEVTSHSQALQDAQNALRQLLTLPIQVHTLDPSELSDQQKSRRSFLQGKRRLAL